MKSAMEDPTSPFTQKITAICEETLGYVPDDLTVPIQGRHAFKAAVREAQWGQQQEMWSSHVDTHKKDGAGLYQNMPHPQLEGFLSLRQHGEYSDKEVNILLNLRMHSHVLASVTGAHNHPPTPLADRECTQCQLSKVEDEAHFLIECPKYARARSLMIEALGDIYPRFTAQWSARNSEQKVRRLLWEIPDGTLPLWPKRGLSIEAARVQATKAVLSFLGSAAKSHPYMVSLMYNKAPNAKKKRPAPQ